MLRDQIELSRRTFLIGVVTTTIAAGLPRVGLAQGVPFEKGEVIRLVVPYGPGGGFDRVLRLIQPYFAKALGELAKDHRLTVIVENMPGAGGRVAYEAVYNGKPDGTRMVLLGDQGAAIQQHVLKARFQLEDFSYLALVNNSDWGILVRRDLNIRSMRDFIARAQKQPILFGTSGAGSGDHIASLILQAILRERNVELPVQHAHFNSSATVFASMQRGESEAYIGSVESTLPAVKDDYAAIISVFADARSQYFPEVATIGSEGIPGAEEIVRAIGISRVLVAGPRTPAERLEFLRRALERTLTNPELLRKADEAQLPVQYGNAERAKATVRGHGDVVQRYRELVSQALGK